MLAGHPDLSLELVYELESLRHVPGIELGQQRVAKAMDSSDPDIVDPWIRRSQPRRMGMAEERVTAFYEPHAEFGCSPPRECRHQNPAAIYTHNEEFVQDPPDEHFRLAGSRPREDLEDLVAWSNLDHGLFGSVPVEGRPASFDKHLVHELKELLPVQDGPPWRNAAS
jgi:hypothetical protein